MDKRRILIVDDEVSLTRLIKLNLEKTGKYDVLAENRGARALGTCREFKPDLVLLDIIMPDAEGSFVAAQIRNDGCFKNTPIIFLTATVLREEIENHNHVIDGYPCISKPVGLNELLKHIEENLQR